MQTCDHHGTCYRMHPGRNDEYRHHEPHSLSWFAVMVCHGSLSWFTVMVHHGSLSWFVMVCHGSSWFTVMVLSWFVMVRDVLFSKILQKRSCDPQFSQSESQIHYQISFLMRLLIFPFPFKEHTSKELC